MKKVTLATVKKMIRENKKFQLKLVPNKTNPYNCWGIGHTVNIECGTEIEKVVNSFIYYNCNNELGMGVHYYIMEG